MSLSFAGQLCSAAIPDLRASKVPAIVAILIVLMAIMTIATSLRLISRWLSAAKYGMDDFLIVLAAVG